VYDLMKKEMQIMADEFVMPKGRTTIRKGGSLTGLTGQKSRRVRLWEYDAKPGTTLAKLESAYLAGLNAVDRAEERTKANAASGKFTPDGVKQDTMQFALNELVPSLHRARTTIQKARAEVAERKSKLTLQGPDKTDVAAAIRRQEIRQFLRDMKPEQQSKFFGSQEGRLPPEILAAVLEMPPELSGVPNTRHTLLMEEAIKAQHGGEAEEIAQLEEAITVAESTVEPGAMR
jgi:hypothetical protein